MHAGSRNFWTPLTPQAEPPVREDNIPATALKYLRSVPRGVWLTLRYVAGMSGPRNVWLTFDDGPHPVHTKQILEVLALPSILATFFVVGVRARASPEMVRAAFDAGHRIGIHSFSHPDLTTLDKSGIREEVLRAEEVIGRYLGSEKLFRPPHGYLDAKVDAVISELGYKTVLWNVSTRDWSERYQPDRWIRHGVKLVRISHESRMLLHDDRETTAEKLGELLDRIERLGNVTFRSPDTL